MSATIDESDCELDEMELAALRDDQAMMLEDEPTILAKPTGALPGTSAKIEELAWRHAQGFRLWHPDDRLIYSNDPECE